MRTRQVATLAFAVLLAPSLAHACSVCFGDPNSPIVKGVETGVWFLLAIIFAVQAGFGVFFFVYLRNRVKGLRDPLPRPMLRLAKRTAALPGLEFAFSRKDFRTEEHRSSVGLRPVRPR